MIKKPSIPPILDDIGSANLFNQIMTNWIEPEIKKRKVSKTLTANFIFNKCLILFPPKKSPIVKFNQECQLLVLMSKHNIDTLVKNQPVYIHQVKEIIDVMPPTINDVQVPFIFLIKTDEFWHMFFDLAPDTTNKSTDNWILGKQMANSLQQSLEIETIIVSTRANKLLNRIGLWCAPSLVLYPLNRMIERLSENDDDGAIKILLEHCNGKFLDTMTTHWFKNTFFAKRKNLIIDSVWAHGQKKYTLAIYTLIPQIEGIMTDWLEHNRHVPKRQKDKLKEFFEAMSQNTIDTVNMISKSTLNFIENLVFAAFEWSDEISYVSPKRHPIEHGKYVRKMYTKKISILVFLLLDTIHYLISTTEPAPPQRSSKTSSQGKPIV